MLLNSTNWLVVCWCSRGLLQGLVSSLRWVGGFLQHYYVHHIVRKALILSGGVLCMVVGVAEQLYKGEAYVRHV